MENNLRAIFEQVKAKNINDKDAIRLIESIRDQYNNKKVPRSDHNPQRKFGTHLFGRYWQEQAVGTSEKIHYQQHFVFLLDDTAHLKPSIAAALHHVSFILLPNRYASHAENFNDHTQQLLAKLKAIFRNGSQGKILVQVIADGKHKDRLYMGLAGLLKTAMLEHTNLVAQMILIGDGKIIDVMRQDCNRLNDVCIKYTAGRRYVTTWKEVDTNIAPKPPWIENGAYLITGGLGGLGYLFAKEMARETANIKLILTGKSPYTHEKQEKCKSLKDLGAEVVYLRTDVSLKTEVEALFLNIDKSFGQLRGIIHSAGVIKDSYIINKSPEDIKKILAPKVYGVENIDHYSRRYKLDFLVLFSSGSGCTGNIGQAGYAAANAYLDEYASYRNDLVSKGFCYGKTLSIDWPLWQNGGMKVSEEVSAYLRETRGMVPMQDHTGIQSFYKAFNTDLGQVMVVEGDTKTILRCFSEDSRPNVTEEVQGTITSSDKDNLRSIITVKFKHLIAETTKQDITLLDAHEPIENYGIESFTIAQLNKRLAKLFAKLTKTLFFEHRTIFGLVTHLVEVHTDECLQWCGMTSDLKHNETNAFITEREHKTPLSPEAMSTATEVREPIAIIGISGRYPMAETLNDFWENLKSGKDCISEIPEDRWSLDGFFNPNDKEAISSHQSYSKWGGFLENMSSFDPLFFNISPREAVNMDPQERLFLEASWEVLEDAGYTRERLRSQHNNKVGVFAGVTKSGYALYGQESLSQHFRPETSFSSVANRVSYYLGINGPSMPIDTMCSSSLTAIHEACKHLYHKECQMAIAGGVNLYTHPENYVHLSRYKMLSKDGKCKSFGHGGNGFVPGEGVGCVLLKPLSQAKADKDRIYAVIRGTSINHGGKTSGYTVPNPKAQADLVNAALEAAQLSADQISYIEAHGTGTELGDPIEIAGLTKAFAQYTSSTQYCAIGSVKSNIGHLEAAAGIAGLSKIVLQLKHKQLVPSLHTAALNPNIDFENSPFIVQKQLSAWPTATDNNGNRQPRTAGISAFGAGGANAHVILQEYDQDIENPVSQINGPVPIPISARDKTALKEYIRKLSDFLKCPIEQNHHNRTKTGKSVAEIEKHIMDLLASVCDLDSAYLSTTEPFSKYDLNHFQQISFWAKVNEAYTPDTNNDRICESCTTPATLAAHLSEEAAPSSMTEDTCSNLAQLAYTLQTGREAMEERVLFIVESMYDLERQLRDYIDENPKRTDYYQGHIELSKEKLMMINADIQTKQRIENCLQNHQLEQLAELWVTGVAIDWNQLYPETTLRRISLPTYPFSRKVFWIPKSSSQSRKKSSLSSPTMLENGQAPQITTAPLPTSIKPSPVEKSDFVQQTLVDHLIGSLDLGAEEIDHEKSFADYGLDSILGVDFIDSINDSLAISLDTIQLFDYSSVSELKEYILSTYAEDISTALEKAIPRKDTSTSTSRENKRSYSPKSQYHGHSKKKTNVYGHVKEPIAIIGISGRYATSSSLEELWGHLSNGDDLIQKVERWDLKSLYTEYDDKERGKYCDSGGFLKDIDLFDPLFFNISGVEASHMDPQQRLFLEESWKALEDAGYAGNKAKGSKSGVYVGCYGGDYQSHFSGPMPAQALWGTMGSVIPSRIAYFLDFKGPAIAVDTSCSSSLVAMHLACKDLWAGETDMALAGGVFVQTTPMLYAFAENAGMLSPDGRCRTFDRSANGFVPGEGVGAVVLKRFSEAQQAGDHIYGLIRGSGINQDGTTNGITAPSAKSQERLLTQIYKEFDIDPEQIQLVEAHGTGTKLGDPIEFSALAETYRKFTDRRQYCALGSIKTNIGHTQYAAGLASILKVVLAMKYEHIPPSLHFKDSNDKIDFQNSPFFVNTESIPWNRTKEKERWATVSAFGASGTNAHIVISDAPMTRPAHKIESTYPILLSAATTEQLQQQARHLLTYCQQNPTADLGNISYTLSTGRRHMDYRLACAVPNMTLLRKSLEDWCRKGASEHISYYQEASQNKRSLQGTNLKAKALLEECLWKTSSDQYSQQIRDLAELYAQGAYIHFDKLYDNHYNKLPLPTYPFAKERYWTNKGVETNHEHVDLIHPLLHQNTSHFGQQRYTSLFTGKEFFLADHQVEGKKVLPGVIYIEMARAAIAHAQNSGNETSVLSDVVWMQPITVTTTTEVSISLYQEEEAIKYEIHSRKQDEDQWIFNGQGWGRTQSHEKSQPLDIDAWKEYCNEQKITSTACYEAIRKKGIYHGPSLQSIVAVMVGKGYALAELSMNVDLPDNADYLLHPSMTDAAIQASMALFLEVDNHTALPFSLDSIVVVKPCTGKMWALIHYDPERNKDSSMQKLDISLYDAAGSLCVQMKNYTSRAMQTPENTRAIGETEAQKSKSNDEREQVTSLLIKPVYDIIDLASGQKRVSVKGKLAVIGGNDDQHEELRRYHTDVSLIQCDATDTVDTLMGKIDTCGEINHLLWLVDSCPTYQNGVDRMIEAQESGVILGFKWIKALLHLGYGANEMEWTILTVQSLAINPQDPVCPTHAGIHGLVGTMAKEYPNWQVRLADMPAHEAWSLTDVFSLPYNSSGNAVVKRNRSWYRQRLLPFENPGTHSETYRQGGLYIVIGGAGGVGRVWTEYMIERYKAQVVWIGRRQKDDTIEESIQRLSSIGGPAPTYHAADASDENSLSKVYQQIIRAYGQPNGILHSAIVLADKSLAKMSEERFRKSLEAKVNISVAMARVFDGSHLDFVLFFSSIQSFAKAPGQSNYAAGCTFKDAFADYLAQQWSCAVRIMNWGYWGSVGIVASEAYQSRMYKLGLASIEAPEAMDALETLLATPVRQLALSKGTAQMQVEGLDMTETISEHQSKDKPYTESLRKIAPDQTAAVQKVKAKVGQQVKALDQYLLPLLWAQLQGIGMFTENNTNIAHSKSKAGIPKLYDRWFDETLTVLSRNNYLQVDGENCTLKSRETLSLAEAWSAWDSKRKNWMENSHLKAQMLLVETTMKKLPEILTGKQQATDVIFPNSSMKLVEGVYKNNAVSDYFNQVLSETLVNYFNIRTKDNPDVRIRILEIGAGTGGTSALVFPKIRPFEEHIQSYCYTDLSKAFLLHAKKNYGPENPYLEYRIFNVEKPLAEQAAIVPGSYDVVIATNVLHATKNISNTLQNAKAAMKKHGLFLLNELSDNVLFSHLTFGLLKGWWLYDDPHCRIDGSPGLYPESWQKMLENEGFRSVYMPAKEAHDMGQAIIVAESDGIIRQKTPYSFDIASSAPYSLNAQVSTKARPPMPIRTKEPSSPLPSAKNVHGIQDKKVLIKVEHSELKSKTITFLKKLVADTLQIPPQKIEAGTSLENYGIDSILVVQLTNALRKVLNGIGSTLFFEVKNIDELSDYFIENRKEALMELLGIKAAAATEPTMPAPSPIFSNSRKIRANTPPGPKAEPKEVPHRSTPKEDIAIIGLSGQYPQAENYEVFWQHLKEGKNCIEEIPSERWDWRAYHSQERGDHGSIYTKWGGFIKDIDKFDPLFFKISPLEASRMDPQERLFLQTAYATIQDAGYTPMTICEDNKVGVFVGVMNGNYPVGAAYFSIANRVSYTFDFNGPSLAVDTACSASLSAIHIALDSLHSGSCRCAIAGGVNLIVAPYHYQKLSALNVLSEGPRCKSFGENADGFVDGEGVGAVLLKPLSKAIADGDSIYGVIKASGLNHGGRTNGYTVPNPNAQGAIIKEVMKQNGIIPESVSYIEAHGTGTSLGDPIEVAGLRKAFSDSDRKDAYCALGSVKSNIGHSEAAAGIAGLTKVLLQMKYGQLVPSLHAENINPEIHLENTPFYLNKTLKDWAPITYKDRTYALRAGISSFGAGGANAHLIIEQYETQSVRTVRAPETIVVLSARSKAQLRTQALDLKTYLKNHHVVLSNLAYTLQKGREEMEERLSVVVDSVDTLTDKLNEYLINTTDQYPEGIYAGNAKEGKKLLSIILDDDDMATMVNVWNTKRKCNKLAGLWVKGMPVNWDLLYPDAQRQPVRVNLPTYPFAKEPYWVDNASGFGKNISHSPPSDHDNASSLIYSHRYWKPSVVKNPFPAPIPLCKQDFLIAIEPSSTNLWSQLATEVSLLKEAHLLRCQHPITLNQKAFGEVVSEIFGQFKTHMTDYSGVAIRVMIITDTGPVAHMYQNAVMAMLKSMGHEHGQVTIQALSFGDTFTEGKEAIKKALSLELGQHSSQTEQVRYESESIQEREALCSEALHPEDVILPVFNDKDVVWFTGGFGGIALHVIENWLQHGLKNAVLIGRSSLDEEKKRKLAALNEILPYGTVIYQQADVSNRSAMESVKENLSARGLNTKGIIHAAGIVKDAIVANKTENDLRAVMSPKVEGTIVLDQVTEGIKLDFFVVFSSIAALAPGIGQCDYASANAFADAFMAYRNQLVSNGNRHGKSIAINWPHWQKGGMVFDKRHRRAMERQTGIRSLTTSEGLTALATILHSGWQQVAVGAVDQQYLKALWVEQIGQTNLQHNSNGRKPSAQLITPKEYTSVDTDAELLEIIAEATQFPLTKIHNDITLNELGIDSIVLMNLVQIVQRRYGIKLFINELQQQNTIGEMVITLRQEVDKQPLCNRDHKITQEEASPSTSNTIMAGPRTAKVLSQLEKEEEPTSLSYTDNDKKSVGKLKNIEGATGKKAKKTIVLLSTPRSGSTLLRVMLNTNPQLFAPPELYLLDYEDMAARRRLLEEDNCGFLTEGMVEALQNLSEAGTDDIKKLLTRFEQEKLPVSKMYVYLRSYLNDNQYLVDKTPSYGQHLDTLRSAEENLDEPFYIYLYRHPLAVMGSLVKNRFHKLMGTKGDPWEIAEDTWYVRNKNILAFMDEIPLHRQLHVPYESLVEYPEQWMNMLCQKLGITYHPTMALPYRNLDKSMVSGVQKNSVMIGDPNFLGHEKIDHKLASAWEEHIDKWKDLRPATTSLAKTLSYTHDQPTFGIRDSTRTTMLPAQKAFLTFSTDDPTWHIALQMEVAGTDLTKDGAKENFDLLIRKLPVLRSRFIKENGQWKLSGHAEKAKDQLVWINAKKMGKKTIAQQKEVLQDKFHKQMSLAQGKLFWVGIFDLPNDAIALLVTVHHLVADGYALHQLTSILLGCAPLKISKLDTTAYQQYLAMQSVPSMRKTLLSKWIEGQQTPRIALPDGITIDKDLYGDQSSYQMEWDKELPSNAMRWDNVAGALYTCLFSITGSQTLSISHRMHRRNVFDNTVIIEDIGNFAGDVPITMSKKTIGNRAAVNKTLLRSKRDMHAGGTTYEVLVLDGKLKPAHEVASIRLNYQPLWGKEWGTVKVLETHTSLYEPDNHARMYEVDCIVRQMDERRWKCIVRYNHKQYSEEQIADFVAKWTLEIFESKEAEVKIV